MNYDAGQVANDLAKKLASITDELFETLEVVKRVQALCDEWESLLGECRCPSCLVSDDCDHYEGYHHALDDLCRALSGELTEAQKIVARFDTYTQEQHVAGINAARSGEPGSICTHAPVFGERGQCAECGTGYFVCSGPHCCEAYRTSAGRTHDRRPSP